MGSVLPIGVVSLKTGTMKLKEIVVNFTVVAILTAVVLYNNSTFGPVNPFVSCNTLNFLNLSFSAYL